MYKAVVKSDRLISILLIHEEYGQSQGLLWCQHRPSARLNTGNGMQYQGRSDSKI
jgi:hypothetical protein